MVPYTAVSGGESVATMALRWIVVLTVTLAGVFGLEPSFDVPVINVTVHEKEPAVLPCSVDALGEHKVVWTDQWSTLLTLDDRRIIDDPRISIERPYMRDWNLHIRKTVYKDRGQYTCQINTNPVKMKTVMLIVLVPSKIINELSSRDKTVQEGATVRLVCNVTGVPMPDVTWYKLPAEGAQAKERLDLDPGAYTLIDSCAYTLTQTGIGAVGEFLIIHNVSRYCDGVYECVAYNDVDPAVTRQIKVFVEFAPEVSLPTRRIGQVMGKETILDCEITAYPHGVMIWMKQDRDIALADKDKYALELYSGNEDSKRKTLSLRVKTIALEDYGEYSCFAQNKIGQDKETMVLYDYGEFTAQRKTTTLPYVPASLFPRTFPDPNNNDNVITDVDSNGNNKKNVLVPNGNPTWTGPGIGSTKNRPHKPGEESAARDGPRNSADSLVHAVPSQLMLSLITSYIVLVCL